MTLKSAAVKNNALTPSVILVLVPVNEKHQDQENWDDHQCVSLTRVDKPITAPAKPARVQFF